MPNVRVTWTLLLWIPGSVLFGIGWVLDDRGWTTAHGFVSNILAAGTTGLIGLPIAAIGVQWILRQDAESRRRRDIVRSARRNFAEMQSSLEQLGIDKVRRLQEPVATACRDVVLLHYAGQFSETIPAKLIREAHSSLSSLLPTLSKNLPSDAEDQWRFLPALRRWEILRETLFSPAEIDGIRVISDKDYGALSKSIEIVDSQRIEWLPNLMGHVDVLLKALKQLDNDENPRIEPTVRKLIGELNGMLSRLEVQVSARVKLHTEVAAAREAAESMAID